MPNAPVKYGLEITRFSAHPQISSELLRKAETILSTTGRIVYFDDEEKLNAVTAISGSGPAYFYYFVQAMIEAGMAMGLSKQVATLLVQQTMLGSFHLLNSSGKSTDELIKTVASKGGTTEAALSHMNSTEVNKNIIEALIKAEKRAKELSEN
jgi:pyrroline-5-carboxylate reductase